jgi:ketosteroid isomerase-like protein
MRSRARLFAVLALATLFVPGCREVQDDEPSGAVLSAEERDVRAARAAQNRAIANGDLDSVADFWTDDVELRSGLGKLALGRAAYRNLFVPTHAPDSSLVYVREPSHVDVSPTWPLAFETGVWAGHLGGVNGASVIRGKYSAQWVKRAGRWLIRGEIFVALSCSGVGCTYAAAP